MNNIHSYSKFSKLPKKKLFKKKKRIMTIEALERNRYEN